MVETHGGSVHAMAGAAHEDSVNAFFARGAL